MNLLNFAGVLGDAIADTWMSIWLSLNDVVYSVIEFLYKVFITVANINLFSDDAFNKITSRVYVVMGIAMLFILAYNLILMIINPEDKKSTGQMSKMVREIIISLVLIVLLPRIFSYMSTIQRHILDSNILGQIIIGDTGGTDDKCNYEEYTLIDDFTDIGEARFDAPIHYIWSTITRGLSETIKEGIRDATTYKPTEYIDVACEYYVQQPAALRGAASIPPTLFAAFYHPTNYGYNECAEYITTCKTDKDCETQTIKTEDDKKMCAYYFHDINMSKYMGNLSPFNHDSQFYSKVKNNEDTFEFNYLMAFAAGILAVYMFACYSISIGVRVAKLGFLQIISPIAVMMRIIPKQKEAIFDKWFNNLKNTYLDVFIRLSIIYFALFAISLIPDVMSNLAVDADGNFAVWLLAEVILILGILKFALDAPKLLQEFFGNSGNFSLKSPKKQFEENKLASKGVGMIAGGIGGAAVGLSRNINRSNGESGGRKAWNGTRGLFGGLYHGAQNGIKNGASNIKGSISSAADSVEENRQTYNARRTSGGGSYFKGLYKEKVDSAKRSYGDFIDYMKGDVASSATGDAANSIIGRADNIENTFSNAHINNIISGRTKVNEDYHAGRDFDFNGRRYHKISADQWQETDQNGNTRTVNHSDLGGEIKDYFKNTIAAAYAENINKNQEMRDGFKIASQSLIKELRDNMPKMGEDFSRELFNKLNGGDLNLNVGNFDELNDRISDILDSNNSAELEKLYKINDEIKSLTKGVKIHNQQAVEAQKARQEQNKKSDGNK